MNPIGLTRAEELALQPQATHSPPAPTGTPSCRVVTLPGGDACGAAATRRIGWPDGDETPACADCAARMVVLAESHRSSVRVWGLA